MIAPLARHLFESTLFCLLMGAVASCLRGHRAAARHAIWLVGVSKFALPTALLAATGAQIAFMLPASSWISSLVAGLYAALVTVLDRVPVKFIPGDAPAVSAIFLAIWALGSIGMLLRWRARLIGSCCALRDPADEEQRALGRTRRRLGLHTSVQLRISESTSEPTLLRFFHPMVVIPEGLSNRLTAAEFEAVLLHELAHAVRRDNLIGAFVHGLLCLFWFHPLLWLAEERLIAERERACDEMVIAFGTPRETYVNGILKVCRFHLIEPVGGVSGMAGLDLNNRLDLILTCPPRRSLPYGLRTLLAGMVIAITFVPIAGGYCAQCVSNGSSTVSQKPGRQVRSPYSRGE